MNHRLILIKLHIRLLVLRLYNVDLVDELITHGVYIRINMCILKIKVLKIIAGKEICLSFVFISRIKESQRKSFPL